MMLFVISVIVFFLIQIFSLLQVLTFKTYIFNSYRLLLLLLYPQTIQMYLGLVFGFGMCVFKSKRY